MLFRKVYLYPKKKNGHVCDQKIVYLQQSQNAIISAVTIEVLILPSRSWSHGRKANTGHTERYMWSGDVKDVRCVYITSLESPPYRLHESQPLMIGVSQ